MFKYLYGIIPYKIIGENNIYFLVNKNYINKKYSFIKSDVISKLSVKDNSILNFYKKTKIKLYNYQLENFFYENYKNKKSYLYTVNFTNKNINLDYNKFKWVKNTPFLEHNFLNEDKRIAKKLKNEYITLDEISYKFKNSDLNHIENMEINIEEETKNYF